MMKVQRWFRTVSLLSVASLFLACGDDESKESKYPGELGATCESKADCDGEGAWCAGEVTSDNSVLSTCSKDCTKDADCGPDGACNRSSVEGHPMQCVRRCETTDFCEDLSTEYNSCQTWSDTRGIKICGFRG